MLNLHLRNIDPCPFIRLVSLLYATFIKKKKLSWRFRIRTLMIPHTNFERFDDSAHEYCIHPRRFQFELNTCHSPWPILHPHTLLIILFRSLGPFLFKRKLVRAVPASHTRAVMFWLGGRDTEWERGRATRHTHYLLLILTHPSMGFLNSSYQYFELFMKTNIHI